MDLSQSVKGHVVVYVTRSSMLWTTASSYHIRAAMARLSGDDRDKGFTLSTGRIQLHIGSASGGFLNG